MAETRRGYVPDEPIPVPALYAWPPRPLAALHYLLARLLFPWGYFFIALAAFAWYFLTPDLSSMQQLEPGWIALLWLRNATLLTVVAGGLHWWLYVRRAQDTAYKFDKRWQASDDKRFLFRDQVHDNMFWSIASGVTIWTLYEALTLWMYASGRVSVISWSEAPVYLAFMCVFVFFWSTMHFYFVHRFLHWDPVYKVAHELHHRNINTAPWSGLSFHPLEHFAYFTLFLLWWVVPVHPVIITLTGFYNGISPAISHSGFDYIRIGKLRVTAGDNFHNLHHRLFEVNYGNSPTPLDKAFGTWHDGSPEAHEALKHRRRR